MSLSFEKEFRGRADIKNKFGQWSEKHNCLMCGNPTSWEERQWQAERLRIYGLSIRQLKDVINFAVEHGYKI